MNIYRILISIVMGSLLLTLTTGCDGDTDIDPESQIRDYSILVFSKTAAFRHNSIEAGVEAIENLAEANMVTVTTTEDADIFNDTDLATFDAVVFVSTSGNIFTDEQRASFQNYIRNGGGYAGIHAASDTEKEWDWYVDLVGAHFENHPRIQDAVIHVEDPNHISTRMLPEVWERNDEWYNFNRIPDHVNVLLALDPDSFNGSDHPDFHPIAWYHDFDGGRAFYTGLGHTIESYSEDLFLQHMWAGIEYAIGVPPTGQ